MNSLALPNTLLPSKDQEVLELDELCSYVYQKADIGDRSAKSCRRFWNSIPQNYRHSTTYSDFWKAYAQVIQTGKHHSVGKDSGQTNHVERWNNTLRQRIGRFVRKTLSFSKSEENHYWFTKWFIVNYNLSLIN